uniref:Uncharacterized protein n=1 Tax=Triticum urartu TaxID=4572 RepID=A0A8R7PX45_TRIUA
MNLLLSIQSPCHIGIGSSERHSHGFLSLSHDETPGATLASAVVGDVLVGSSRRQDGLAPRNPLPRPATQLFLPTG